MDKNKFKINKKEKLEEMINFYNENIHKIKLWGRDKERREIFRQVVLDEKGNKILVEIKEETENSEKSRHIKEAKY